MYKPGVDCIVVNWHTPALLLNFLNSYLDHGTPESSLYVVNNEPTDADHQAVVSWLEGDVSRFFYIFHEENIGYGRAVNDAAKHGDREVIAIFNSDTELREGVMGECHQALMANDGWGVLGPRQVDRSNRLNHAGIVGTNQSPTWRTWMSPDTGLFSDVIEAVTVMGSAYFIKRDVWDSLVVCPLYREIAPEAEGAFLPTQHFYEETWASYHARAHGWKVIYYGPACMYHAWHQSSPVGSQDENMRISREFFRKACDHHDISHD